MTAEAPRAFNRDMYYGHPENVFYGTDDGRQDGSFEEFATFEDHYNNVSAERRDDIHMMSVVGGLYGLNLIPLWRPKRLTFFDSNSTALTYFRLVHRVFTSSRDPAEVLSRLTAGDYDAENDEEMFVRENICLKQRGELPRSRGSTKRPYEESWTIAFRNFELTKRLLSEIPIEIRSEPMESDGFRNWLRKQNNTWIYCSNITEFHYFDLEIEDPTNVVVAQIIFPGEEQILDLAPLGGEPVKIRFEIPLSAERING